MHAIIIGNGVAGNSAASVIRKFGERVTMISEEVSPEYSPCVFPNYLSGEIERQRVFLKSPKDYSEAGIRTIFGKKALGIDAKDRKVFLEDGDLDYDKLLIATGSEPIIPDIEGVHRKEVFTQKKLGDMDRILARPGRKAVVIGSGPTGVETGIALRKRGFRVFLIEELDWILPKVFDEKPAGMIEDALRKREIETLTGERVVKILGKEEVEGIETDGREIECDMVILAVGMKPRVDLARHAGVKIGGLGGIVTDERMMTNLGDVYACGDCTESRDVVTGRSTLNLLWPNAVLQGRVAGNNCVGIPKKYRGFINIVGMDLFGTHVASIGHTLATIGNGGGCEVVEKARGTYYSRIILKNGTIVGAQFIGRTEKMGALFGAIWKKAHMEDIKKAVSERELLTMNPWYMGIRPYLWS